MINLYWRLVNWWCIRFHGVPSRHFIGMLRLRVIRGITTRQSIALEYIRGRTIESVAKEHVLTRERVRQILLKIAREGHI